jgi:hypothetical protein
MTLSFCPVSPTMLIDKGEFNYWTQKEPALHWLSAGAAIRFTCQIVAYQVQLQPAGG